MATTNHAKIVPYILVLPRSSPLSPSPTNEHDENDHDNRRRNDTAWAPTKSCPCLALLLVGIGLLALVSVSIAIPLIITLSISRTEMSSTTSTAVITTTLSTTTSTSVSTTTDIPCSTTCTSQQTCVKGACIGIGYLSCTLTWSRNGDGDIVVTTPNNNTIDYMNRGPSVTTDQGQLDKDDTNGTGPENVFWSNSSSVPPAGVYYVCFEPYNFNPIITSINPITATIKVLRPNYTPLIVAITFTSTQRNNYTCNSISNTLLTSFTYP